MAKIRVLTDTLASQVAAGEVVERPASVVKELVENSIDAGAREVLVEIQKGGAALIRVQDDGCGMSREDALLSLERHATSKLKEASDLAAIRTLGFRGEAVPSIASVSRFRMLTREADSVVGTEIAIDGGTLRDVRDAGCAPGTTIEAKSLFFNVPARRKFLSAESTESAHVEHQLRLHALAAPWIRMRLRRNDRDVFDLPAVERPVDRVRQLLGTELAVDLVDLPRTEAKGIAIEGHVLPARHARKGRRHQHVLLNGRPVEDAVISRALAEGFRGQVVDGMHPAAWLWIEMDPMLVDVNVHPAKREVRFHRPADLKQAIVSAVVDGLRQHEASRLARSSPKAQAAEDATVKDAAFPPRPQSMAAAMTTPQPELGSWQGEEAVQTTGEPVDAGVQVPPFRAIGILHNRYVVMESEDGMVLLDPRAAHERIWYESLMGHAGDLSQGLLVPVLLDLDPRDVDALMSAQDALADAGIEIDLFGGNTVQVRSLPVGLPLDDPRAFIMQVLDTLLHDSVSGAKRFARDRMARVCARRAAVGIQARLSEVPALLKSLFACDLPYCTADGRPTLSEFGLGELDKRFGNKGG